MERSLAVHHVKPQQLGAWDQPPSFDEPGFVLELEHRVWLARFGARHDDPLRYDWDRYGGGSGLPETWLPSPLSTTGFGGAFHPGELGPLGAGPDVGRAWGPLPGDRVVAYRRRHQQVVGVWLVTGSRFGPRGQTRYGVRPVLSCLEPVEIVAHRSQDADLDQAWEQTFGRSGAGSGALMGLGGPALSGVIRSVGIDPRLMCGPVAGLPDCSLLNRPPAAGFRPATRLQTMLSASRRADERALGEAVQWIRARSLVGFGRGPIDMETVGAGDLPGFHLVARCGNAVHRVTTLGLVSDRFDDLELCPTVVLEAADAARDGRAWSLMVTFDALGVGRTLRFDAPMVALCFDSRSGRMTHRGE
jgi:hypothetical protein